MFLSGRCLWKLSTPFCSPLSRRICSPIRPAAVLTAGETTSFNACERLSTVIVRWGIGAGPAFWRCIMSPQNLHVSLGRLMAGHLCRWMIAHDVLLITEEGHNNCRQSILQSYSSRASSTMMTHCRDAILSKQPVVRNTPCRQLHTSMVLTFQDEHIVRNIGIAQPAPACTDQSSNARFLGCFKDRFGHSSRIFHDHRAEADVYGGIAGSEKVGKVGWRLEVDIAFVKVETGYIS